MMTFKKLPPISGPNKTPLTRNLDMASLIAAEFGCAGYSKDGNDLYAGEYLDASDPPTVGDVERLAKETETEHDWRIYFFGLLYNAEYQRQGDGLWVLVKSGKGFA